MIYETRLTYIYKKQFILIFITIIYITIKYLFQSSKKADFVKYPLKYVTYKQITNYKLQIIQLQNGINHCGV